MFNKVLEKFSSTFEVDETLTLIVRLRQNVIRTAIRQISLAYSRIPIQDIAKKLQVSKNCKKLRFFSYQAKLKPNMSLQKLSATRL